MADEAPKPVALGFHHNQLVVIAFAIVVSWAGSYLTTRDQITTMASEIKTLKDQNAALQATIKDVRAEAKADAEKNERYRNDMQNTITEMRIILGQRKR